MDLGARVRKAVPVVAGVCLAVLLLPPRVGLAQVSVLDARLVDWCAAAAFHPSRPQLAVAYAGRVRVYARSTRAVGSIAGAWTQVAEVPVHLDYIRALAYSPDGASLYSAGLDLTLATLAMDPEPGALRAARRPMSALRPEFLAVSPDGRIATNGSGSELVVWSATDPGQSRTYGGFKAHLTGAVFSPLGDELLASDERGRIGCLDLAGGTITKEWGAHSGAVVGILINNVGQVLVSAGADGEVKVWDLARLKQKDSRRFDAGIVSLACSHDGRYYFVGLKNGDVHILGPALADVCPPLTGDGRPIALAVDSRGQYLAIGTDLKQLRIWDLHTIKPIAMAHQAACELALRLSFSDEGALIPNNAIDGGEDVSVTATLENKGDGTAYDLNLDLTGDSGCLEFPSEKSIGDLVPGGEVAVRIPMKSSLTLLDGPIHFTCLVTEGRGFDARAALEVQGIRLPMPRLSIIDMQLQDQELGVTRGNGNGIPENGEVVAVEVFVANQGEGRAWKPRLTLTHRSEGIEDVAAASDISPIDPGKVESGRLIFEVPRTYRGDDVRMELQVLDSVTNVSVRGDHSWPTQHNVPVLSATLRAIGPVQNGSSAQFEAVVENTGSLDAEAVKVSFNLDQPLPVVPKEVDLGNIPPGGKSRPIPLSVDLPRNLGVSHLTLTASLEQQTFSGSVIHSDFEVGLRRPVLEVLDLGTQASVRQGGEFILLIGVQNTGSLAAENASVHVEIPRLGATRDIAIGLLAPGKLMSIEGTRFPVPMRVSTGPMPVEVRVTQTQFDPGRWASSFEVAPADIALERVEPEIVSPGRSGDGALTPAPDLQPEIELLTPPPTTVHGTSYSIHVLAKAPAGVRDLTITLNGEVQYQATADPAAVKKLQIMNEHLEKDVTLRNLRIREQNALVITLVDNDKRVERFERSMYCESAPSRLSEFLDPNVDVNRPPQTQIRNPAGIALIIAVSSYQRDEIPDVEFAKADAAAMRETLIRTLGFSPDNIVEVVDAQATRTGIAFALKVGLKSRVKLGDSDLFVFYSGHGAPDFTGTRNFLVPFDGQPTPDGIEVTCYPLDEFYGELASLHARSVTVAIDACFSGSSEMGPLIPDISPLRVSAPEDYPPEQNWSIFTACGPGEVSSWYREGKHGLFTYYFLQGIQRLASSEDGGEIRASEIQQYLSDHVPTIAGRMKRSQSPQFRGKDRVLLDLTRK